MVMNYSKYLKLRQIQWAVRHSISFDKNGSLASYNENIFGGLSHEIEEMFSRANGNELRGKMKSLHSSSALCVNVFCYLRNDAGKALKALGMHDSVAVGPITFEYKDKIIGKIYSNLDMMLETSGHFYAVESKFLEIYSSHSNLLKSRYLAADMSDVWGGLPCIYEYLTCMEDRADGKHLDYSRLDAAQLIKHLLGLMRNEKIGRKKSRFSLVYLYYDAPGDKGAVHRAEIARFAELMASDRVNFKAVTYQDVMYNLNTILDYNSHKEYLDYINERYM